MMADTSIVDEIASRCLMSRMRRLNRQVTNIYEDELRQFGVKASQLHLLIAVAKAGPVRRIDIGKYVGIDPSTLTRNLGVMQGKGWIETILDGKDARSRPIKVTAKGTRLIERVAPAWRKAQEKAKKMLGPDGSNLLRVTSKNTKPS